MVSRFISGLALSAAIVCSVAGCAQPAAQHNEIGINVASMDTAVRPGDDFNAYANGGYERDTEIPADRASIGSFYAATLETERQNTELIQGIISSHPQAGTDAARIANFYNAFANTQAIDAAGMAPAQADIARFNAIANRTDLSRVLGEQVRADVDPINATNFFTENLFGIFVTQGLATPGEVLPYILQGGLGLPDRDYYVSNEAGMAQIRTQYRAYIQQVLTLSGIPDAAAKAQRIYDLEVRIARTHATRLQSSDVASSAAVWSRADLQSRAPGIDWTAFLAGAQLPNQQRFGAYHAQAITGLSALVASQPLQAWKDWLVFHQINSHANVLPSQIDQASFAFFGTTLSGIEQQRPREKRALNAVSNFLGDAVGRAYVDRYFPASAREEVQTMVENIKQAFARRIQSLEWMAPATREEALRKVNSLVVGVGYPDTWRDYATYQVSATDAYANAINGERFEYLYQIAKIGHPMDRNEWWMTPQTVNAVNLPVQNAMNFPAAIMQPPFFNASADPAYNYGAIGSVIGHEISHSFDDSGAAFDSTGAMRNWWTDADLAAFRAQGQALVRQYDAYEALPGLHLNGALTLGENIADVAGLQAAYDAYRASLGGREAPVINGMTGDQRFFLAYAQSRASKTREAALRQQIATDGHAPGNFRAQIVRNIDGWYTAFNVQAGETLYLAPDQRVTVW